MNIGLYHLEMWGRGTAVPNLELMKIYNYYYSKNYKVTMVRPNDALGRFDKIFYFKDNPNTVISKSLNLTGSNKKLLGYGFYKKTEILKPEIFNLPPLYYIYDSFLDRLSYKERYESLKKNSYVRVETNDFVDLKPNTLIYVADYDFCAQEKAEDFLDEYKNRSIFFFHQPKLSCAALPKFSKYSQTLRPRIIDLDEDVFIEECYDRNIIFPLNIFPKETIENYRLRLMKMGLIYKNKKTAPPRPRFYSSEVDDFADKIMNWIVTPEFISFSNFYSNNSQIQNQIFCSAA